MMPSLQIDVAMQAAKARALRKEPARTFLAAGC